MGKIELGEGTLSKIQKLIEANFTGRDELYAAAESSDDEARKQICCQLAAHLADHAVHLQQIVASSGVDPAEPLDVNEIASALFDLAKANRGETGVLQVAAEGERNLKEEFDRAIETTPDQEAKALLDKQRDNVEFGEQVLRNIHEKKVE